MLERTLGEGGSGLVYLVQDRARGEQVALKSLTRVEPAGLLRLKNEFRQLADFAHPNVARLYELVVLDDSWFVAMEYIDGVDFLSYVRDRGPQSPDAPPVPRGHTTALAQGSQETTTCETMMDVGSKSGSGSTTSAEIDRGGTTSIPRLRAAFTQLVEGVRALHESGFVHRDLKPSNVYVDRSGRVAILDFGLVSEVGLVPVQDGEGHLVGTPAYIAPERILDPLNSETPSDWYSVGIMLYEALTGRRLFRGEWHEIRTAKLKIDPPPPSHLLPVPEDLEQLCLSLLSRDPTQRPSGEGIQVRVAAWERPDPNKDAPSLASITGLIGRHKHLARLRAAFEEIRSEASGRALFLRGRSGEGKTSLAEAFLDEMASDPSVCVIRGRCHEMETVPYKAIDSLIDSLCTTLLGLPAEELEGLAPRDAAAVVQVFPVLRRIDVIRKAAAEGEIPPDATEVRRLAFDSVTWILNRLAGRGGLILFIDDLHWGDIDSAEFLYRLVDERRPELLFLATHRLDEEHSSELVRSLLERGTEKGTIASLRVGRLPLKQAHSLAHTLLEASGADVSKAEPIARAAKGIPFLLHELVRFVVGGGTVSGTEIDVAEALAERIARLEPNARHTLEVIAVSTRPVSLEFLRQVSEERAPSARTLSDLRQVRLIRARGQSASAKLEPYHDRIRQAIVAGMSSAARIEHHRRIARAIEEHAPKDHDVLAYHYLAAGHEAKAAGHLLQAAKAAEKSLAFDRAAEFYQLALKHSPQDAPGREALLRKLGDALANAGRGADAARAYLSASGGTDREERSDLNRRAAMQYLISGHTDDGIQILRRALEDVGLQFPERGSRVLIAFLSRRLQLRVRGLGYRSQENREETSFERLRLDACWSASIGLGTVDPMPAAYFHTRYLLHAMRLGAPERIARGLVLEAAYQAAPGGPRLWARSEKLFNEAEEVAKGLKDPHLDGLIELNRGFICFLHGRWREALDRSERARKILRNKCTGVAWELDTANATTMWALYMLGELGKIERRLPEILRDAEARGDLYIRNHLRTWIQPVVFCMRDEPERALAGLKTVTKRLSRGEFKLEHLNALIGEMIVRQYIDDGEAAWLTIRERWSDVKRSFLLHVEQVRVAMFAYRTAAALSASRGSLDARDELRDARKFIRHLRRETVAWARPCALALDGNVAAILGNRSQALELLSEGERLYRELDMKAFAAMARMLRGKLMGDDAGAALVESAEEYLRQQGVRSPYRLMSTFLTEPAQK